MEVQEWIRAIEECEDRMMECAKTEISMEWWIPGYIHDQLLNVGFDFVEKKSKANESFEEKVERQIQEAHKICYHNLSQGALR